MYRGTRIEVHVLAILYTMYMTTFTWLHVHVLTYMYTQCTWLHVHVHVYLLTADIYILHVQLCKYMCTCIRHYIMYTTTYTCTYTCTCIYCTLYTAMTSNYNLQRLSSML